MDWLSLTRLIVLVIVAVDGCVQCNRTDDLPACEFNVTSDSLHYWKRIMHASLPDIIHFTIYIHPIRLVHVNQSDSNHLVNPFEWTWTAHKTFLHWPIDYGKLSLGLLKAKTEDLDYIDLQIRDENCSIILNSVETNRSIANALLQLVQLNNNESIPKHTKNLFCYLLYTTDIPTTLMRFVTMYLSFPYASYMKIYRCAHMEFNFASQSFEIRPDGVDVTGVWPLLHIAPYFLGILMYLYFPIILLEICSWLSKEERIQRAVDTDHYTFIEDDAPPEFEAKIDNQEDFVFLKNNSPLTLLDIFGNIAKPLRTSYPRLKSRLVRFVSYCLIPALMIPQLYLYRNGISSRDTITVFELTNIGVPYNFLELLGKHNISYDGQFVHCFGGPKGILIIYFALGFLLFVVPLSLKQVIENGIPRTRSWSPLFLGGDEIRRLSGFKCSKEAGYQNAANVCKCSVYMLGTKSFWVRVFQIQAQRFQYFSEIIGPLRYVVNILLSMVLLFEIILCLLFYGFPLFGCMAISISGAMVSISYIELGQQRFGRMFRTVILSIIYILVIIAWALVAYSLALIFLQVFLFVCQVIIFCFVAVFTYPSSSFGFLFFYVVIVFYILSNVAEFREEYHDLLNTAVEISVDLIHHGSDEDFRKRNLRMSSMSSDSELDQYPNPAPTLNVCSEIVITTRNQEHGIPRDLFFQLVDQFKPVHVKIMQLVVKLGLLSFFVLFALNVTNKSIVGHSSEISEVMHVIFVVVLGAVPKMVKLALFHENHRVARVIEHRQIKEAIKKYWLKRVQEENRTHDGNRNRMA